MGSYKRSQDTRIKPRSESRHDPLEPGEIVWIDYGEIRSLDVEDARWLRDQLDGALREIDT